MLLSPQELDKLTLHQAGVLAQKRLARGTRLNHPEAVALIATQLLELIAAEGLIVTAGAIDAHVHFICPQLADVAIASGVTTLIGGGAGPPPAATRRHVRPRRTRSA